MTWTDETREQVLSFLGPQMPHPAQLRLADRVYEVFEQHGKPVDHTTVAAALGESHQSAVRSALTIARERWRGQHPDAMPSSKEALGG